ncbi:alpha/beta fold hydrolase [Actinomadura namibiensis]|uniref:Pimeloyl-ACP methyl ester carboxylesterase n=2 Tax=Actinomadura TaxID=1988 RepID=A0A7W3LYY4_ACTNM|nr:alpha/beta fold hydrolase [Actinomadura namibiensis]MBA8956799.1 pimeloyl-ACP methyl ester carboxylesterase [Actinomadura namibiensis]
MSRNLKVPVADTVLDCNDTEGPGRPILLLNGMYATQRYWRGLLPLLTGRYRVVTFDGRARGKSGTSSDYSFAGCLDDITAVLDATGLQRPILAGWSHGAALAVRYAARHPDRVAGVVCVDGGYPMDPIDDAFRAKVRKLFRRNAIPIKILAALGLGSRMSAAQAAEANIEFNEILAEFADDYTHIRCPVAFIKATGKHMGATEEEVRTMRANLDPVLAAHPNVTVFATVPSNHSQMVANPPDTIAAAINVIADQTAHTTPHPANTR